MNAASDQNKMFISIFWTFVKFYLAVLAFEGVKLAVHQFLERC